jgi:hypothetical protein
MYLDKPDGKVTADFFERHAAEWRKEQIRLSSAIESHREAAKSYIEEGVMLLELASRAHELYTIQPSHEKRQLLRFMLSNSTLAHGELTPIFRHPFDVIVLTAASCKKAPRSVGLEMAENKEWLLR